MPEKTLDFMGDLNGLEAFCYATQNRTVVKCDSGNSDERREGGNHREISVVLTFGSREVAKVTDMARSAPAKAAAMSF